MKNLWVLAVVAALASGCAEAQPPATTAPASTAPAAAAPKPAARLANPASEHCVSVGGESRIESRPDGGQFGVCYFDDNRQCEEWALLRGHCPVGGRKVTGYVTAAARYCAITGGTYSITARSGAADEQGRCVLPSGTDCDAGDYYAGRCPAINDGAPQ